MTARLLRNNLSICLLFLAFFTTNSHAEFWVYTVVDGDNLWNFSGKHLDKVTRFEQLRKINNIDDPEHMKPGSVIRVPMAWIKSNLVPASVHSINGKAEIERSKSGERVAASSSSEIYLGDILRTDANSGVAIQFADASIVSVYENSVVRFDHLSAHGTTGMVDSRINLLQGRLSSKVTPASGPGSRFEIHTPSAISAVRGTAYRAVVADGGAVSNIEVVEGKVAVKGSDKQRLIPKGYATQVAAGAPPSEPKKLLAAPVFNSVPLPIRKLNWRLEWQAVSGAKAYRVEVSASEGFETLLWQGVSEYTRAALPDLPDGDYHLRVRAIDEMGLEGFERAIKVVLDARPQPPLPLKPSAAQEFRGESPDLEWTASADAKQYQLEIADNPEFASPLVDEIVSATRFTTAATLPEIGQFHWRLTSIADDGEYGPLGVSRNYEVKAIPAQPEASLGGSDDGKLIASWEKTSEGQTYQVQIASDKNFKNIIVDQAIELPEFAFERHEGSTRYMRVKTIESDGYESPWGTTQFIEGIPKDTNWFVLVGIFLIVLL